MGQVDLSKYDNSWYKPGGVLKRTVWHMMSLLFFKSSWPFPSRFKKSLLTIFGAEIGNGVVIKPSVNIKYPWFLKIGDNVWIGEEVWIDNLADVILGNNVCLSQGAFLLTGNHNYKKETFDLITEPITIEDGVWVGAKAVICPGVKLGYHSVISVGSVVSKNTDNYGIYRGIPAELVGQRVI
ncbi:MAG: WcaF family extracellular polysaccharide biosynthesis acetyltransferase [Thermodesulfobacteriota bacterium]